MSPVSGEHIERELKLDLGSKENYCAILSFLGAARETRHQENHFFETPTGALRKTGWALRVRVESILRDDEVSSYAEITAKGKSTISGAVTSRPEITHTIGVETARAIIGGSLSIQTISCLPLAAVAQCVAGEELSKLVLFSNIRRCIPLQLDGTTVLMEMDEAIFPHAPGGAGITRTDYELEVEGDEALVAKAEAALPGLFSQWGIPYIVQKKSKFRRALEAAGLSRDGSDGRTG